MTADLHNLLLFFIFLYAFFLSIWIPLRKFKNIRLAQYNLFIGPSMLSILWLYQMLFRPGTRGHAPTDSFLNFLSFWFNPIKPGGLGALGEHFILLFFLLLIAASFLAVAYLFYRQFRSKANGELLAAVAFAFFILTGEILSQLPVELLYSATVLKDTSVHSIAIITIAVCMFAFFPAAIALFLTYRTLRTKTKDSG